MPQSIISQFERQYNSPIEVHRKVADASARDLIPTLVRWEGMLVFVASENQTYILNNGLTNSDWKYYGHSNGVTDTFTTTDGKTVTVENGIITQIV